jgi:cytoskeletal protein CcmA (bactofilin family)
VNAKGVVVQGKLDGNIRATDRVELQKSAIAVGDVVTKRISIDDGAYLKGKVDIQRDGVKAESATAAAGGSGKTPVTDVAKN